jgi:hypothetical protein
MLREPCLHKRNLITLRSLLFEIRFSDIPFHLTCGVFTALCDIYQLYFLQKSLQFMKK